MIYVLDPRSGRVYRDPNDADYKTMLSGFNQCTFYTIDPQAGLDKWRLVAIDEYPGCSPGSKWLISWHMSPDQTLLPPDIFDLIGATKPPPPKAYYPHRSNSKGPNSLN